MPSSVSRPARESDARMVESLHDSSVTARLVNVRCGAGRLRSPRASSTGCPPRNQSLHNSSVHGRVPGMPLRSDMKLVSTDDHVVEHPRVWADRLPAALRADGPTIVDQPRKGAPDGAAPAHVWQFE